MVLTITRRLLPGEEAADDGADDAGAEKGDGAAEAPAAALLAFDCERRLLIPDAAGDASVKADAAALAADADRRCFFPEDDRRCTSGVPSGVVA